MTLSGEARHFSLGRGVTEPPRSPGPPGLPAPCPPTARRRLTKTRARGGGTDCSQGWGWASAPRGAHCLCPTQWEKSQLDEEFLHSVENVCGCAKYECGEWGRGAHGVEPGWAGQAGPDVAARLSR